jgi:hypothetical protein
VLCRLNPSNHLVKGKLPVADWGHPAFLAMFDLMMKVVENQIACGSDDPVDFIFDDHVKWRLIIPIWYEHWKRMANPKFAALMGATPLFRDDHQFLPLQAADLQSWYFRRLFAEKLRGNAFPDDVPKELFKGIDSIPTLISVWDPGRLRNLSSGESSREIDYGPRKTFTTIHDLLQEFAAIEGETP